MTTRFQSLATYLVYNESLVGQNLYSFDPVEDYNARILPVLLQKSGRRPPISSMFLFSNRLMLLVISDCRVRHKKFSQKSCNFSILSVFSLAGTTLTTSSTFPNRLLQQTRIYLLYYIFFSTLHLSSLAPRFLLDSWRYFST